MGISAPNLHKLYKKGNHLTDPEFLTGKKIAEKIGVSAGKVTKFIKENDIQPDAKKCNCKYYAPNTVATIEKGLKSI